MSKSINHSDSNKNPAGRQKDSDQLLKFLSELINYCSLNESINQSIPCLKLDQAERKEWKWLLKFLTWSRGQSVF